MEKDLKRAAYIQESFLPKNFPTLNNVYFESIHKPLKAVGGDFYNFYKVADNFVIGILFDVIGNGVSAALSVFAYNILFHKAVLKYKEPVQIINYMNESALIYLKDNYATAQCFSFDFNNNILKVSGAGGSKLFYKKGNEKYKKLLMKGPFMGMFSNVVFDEHTIKFNSADVFHFFTDGIEKVFTKEILCEDFPKISSLNKLNLYLNSAFQDFFNNPKEFKDDCTLISFQVK